MPTLPQRAAAYTRTGILRRFLDQLADAPPPRVDAAYATQRLDLRGGDVRAFLQALRVLGFTDPYGALTDRARRARAAAQRSAAIREALAEAYPELCRQWIDRGGTLTREEIEDFFKVAYGLSASTAGPAAKLFQDLAREHGLVAARTAPAVQPLPGLPPTTASAPPQAASPPAPLPAAAASTVPGETREPGPDPRLAALDTIRSSLKIDIDSQWDEARIQLVFDRMERLVDRILAGSGR